MLKVLKQASKRAKADLSPANFGSLRFDPGQMWWVNNKIKEILN
jgi:hypothetical protein